MHYADINAALHKVGVKPSEVARKLKVSRSTVSEVIHGKSTSRRVARHIAKVTGIPMSRLWPDRYGVERSGQAA